MARLKHITESDTPVAYWTNNTAAAESVISTAFADAISRTGIQRQQVFGGHTPTESVKRCQQITNRYTFCPPPDTAELGRWTRLTFSGSTSAKSSTPHPDYVNSTTDRSPASNGSSPSGTRNLRNKVRACEKSTDERGVHPGMRTGSGIRSFAMMGLNMRIRAISTPNPGSGDSRQQSQAQMLFTDQEASKLQPIVPGVAYR
ncbi:MAG: hypothetical protein Q9222_003101 [Ikaeria aurantiellina]